MSYIIYTDGSCRGNGTENSSGGFGVVITKDNKLVVFHDYNLKRMCNVDKNIEDCTYKELLKYNLLDTKYKIPLLEEVLRLLAYLKIRLNHIRILKPSRN